MIVFYYYIIIETLANSTEAMSTLLFILHRYYIKNMLIYNECGTIYMIKGYLCSKNI